MNMRLTAPLFLTFFLLFSSQFPCNNSNNVPANLNLEKVCRRTIIYDFCRTALATDPRSAGADLFTLAEIALGMTLANVADNLIFVQRSYQNCSGTEEGLRECLYVCSDLYADGENALADAFFALEGMDFVGMGRAVSVAEERAVACEEEVRRRGVVLPALREKNLYAKNLCVVTSAVGDVLGDSLAGSIDWV